MISVLIIAGGIGERLWPLSNQNMPKQFLDIFTGNPLIIDAIQRANKITKINNIFIITNKNQKKLFLDIKNRFPGLNLLFEPQAKNTLTAISYGALQIEKMCPGSSIIVLSADHVFDNEKKLSEKLKQGVELSREKESIVIYGASVNEPSISYGYIKHKNKHGFYSQVIEFVEKPNKELAKIYMNSDNYLWNCGMFIFDWNILRNNLSKHCKDFYEVLINAKTIDDLYDNVESKSFDSELLEKVNNLYVVEFSSGWKDVGTYKSFPKIFQVDNNESTIVNSVVHGYKSKNNLIINQTDDIYLYGINDLVIVKNNEKIFLCNKKNIDEIKEYLEWLSHEKIK